MNKIGLLLRLLFKKRPGIPFKVNFLIAGAQKGGTTALDMFLGQHPQISMALDKEVHFFDNEKLFKAGRKVNYDRYHFFFSPDNQNQMVGDATPNYMYWPPAAQRIFDYNPQMKFILVLRNPIERAFSQWNMQRDRKIDHLSFYDAIQQESERCKPPLSKQNRIYSYVDRGFYATQIERLWSVFPKEQILILKNEDLRNDLQNSLDLVCDFLGVSLFEQKVESKTVHARPYVNQLGHKEKAYLIEIFKPEIRKLEKMLHWDCNQWLQV